MRDGILYNRSKNERCIDTASAADLLRARIVDVGTQRILISRIAGSEQELDLTVPANCNGFGRIRHFRRNTAHGWPPNPLPIDPAARALKLKKADILRVQAFQNAACAWRCWYCFVPFKMLTGNSKLGAWMSADDLLDLYVLEDDRAGVIDLTGGSPDLTPEWILWFMRALRARGLEHEIYLWSDDNLSTDFLWRYLTAAERRELAAYPMYGRVACFKGFDASSFRFNTQADPKAFSFQFKLIRRLIDEGIDCYGYATFTAESDKGLVPAMHDFVDRLQHVHPNLPLRTIPLRIELFSPVQKRLDGARHRALEVQDVAIAAWNVELARRYSPAQRAIPIEMVIMGRD